jgi:hypothetical protein
MTPPPERGRENQHDAGNEPWPSPQPRGYLVDDEAVTPRRVGIGLNHFRDSFFIADIRTN